MALSAALALEAPHAAGPRAPANAQRRNPGDAQANGRCTGSRVRTISALWTRGLRHDLRPSGALHAAQKADGSCALSRDRRAVVSDCQLAIAERRSVRWSNRRSLGLALVQEIFDNGDSGAASDQGATCR